MRRDLDALTGRTFDVLVIGAGIHGAFAAWDAALRGLSVALIDRRDFGGGASANSLKVIHGGLRYLQQLDFARMRESIAERSTLMRIAPALVKPMPFAVATRGAGRQSAAAMGAALWLTDRIGADRNRGLPEDRRIPGGRIVSRDELARLAPDLPIEGATGGAVWYDAQVTDPERLVLACVQGAADRGAVVANYVELRSLVTSGGGANVVDLLTGGTFMIEARAVVHAAGGRFELLEAGGVGGEVALAMNLVVDRRLGGAAAFGVRSVAPPDPSGTGGRYLFVVPWRDSTMIGTFYRLTTLEGLSRRPTRIDLIDMIGEVRRALPSLDLRESDVRLLHAGMLPLKGAYERGDPRTLAQRSTVTASRSVRGLFTMVGVKFTTARRLARSTVDVVERFLRRSTPCTTSVTPLTHARPAADPATIDEAEMIAAIRDEMAVRLADVVMRRTAMGTQGCPPRAHLDTVAWIMARELGWDETRVAAEIHSVRAAYAPCATDEPAGAVQPMPMRVAHG
jgi:glycerol-3-phosphate dehydrogenase